MSYVRPAQFRSKLDNNRGGGFGGGGRGGDHHGTGPASAKVNEEIILHNKKRAIEGKVYELRVQLEEEGVASEEVEKKCDSLRLSLETGGTGANLGSSSFRSKDSHAIGAAKEHENARVRAAFGLRDKDEEEGAGPPRITAGGEDKPPRDETAPRPRFLDRGGVDGPSRGRRDEQQRYVPVSRDQGQEGRWDRGEGPGVRSRDRDGAVDRDSDRGRDRDGGRGREKGRGKRDRDSKSPSPPPPLPRSVGPEPLEAGEEPEVEAQAQPAQRGEEDDDVRHLSRKKRRRRGRSTSTDSNSNSNSNSGGSESD